MNLPTFHMISSGLIVFSNGHQIASKDLVLYFYFRRQIDNLPYVIYKQQRVV